MKFLPVVAVAALCAVASADILNMKTSDFTNFNHSIYTTDFMGLRSNARRSLGSMTCAACTVLTGMVEQLASVHRENHEKAFDRLCDLFPSPFSTLCGAFKFIYGGNIRDLLSKGQSPDVVCVGNGMCERPANGGICHLYPIKNKLDQKSPEEVTEYITDMMANSVDGPALMARGNTRIDFCAIPLLGTLICNWLNMHAFSIQHPKNDDDNDWFSDTFTLRGSAWRGKDCNPKSGTTYPGRRPENNDLTRDSNCNGISGKGMLDSLSMENELCDFTDARGLIVLGDSVAANFHIPGIWFDATKTTPALFKDLETLMDNSFNWPHTGFFTGYKNDQSAILEGETDSIYLRMRERNLCNHRDYQNIGVNGARTTDAAEFVQTIKRTPQDRPATVFFSYLGNDVCKYNADPAKDDTTTPAQARSGLLATMAVLNQKLAVGSYAVVVGVADARPFFTSLREKIHPFGAYRKDVRYLDFYSWMDCLEINPCPGWLTDDENVREITAKRLEAINAALKKTVEESQHAFPNVKMIYLQNPIDELLVKWTASGGESWELVEAFDGFHPNQKAHKLVAEVLWNRLDKDFPQVLGKQNPKNNLIRGLFDNQGGH